MIGERVICQHDVRAAQKHFITPRSRYIASRFAYARSATIMLTMHAPNTAGFSLRADILHFY